MKRVLVIVGLVAVLLTSAYAQDTIVKAKVPYTFEAAGTTMPAGVYQFRMDEPSYTMRVRNVETGKEVIVPIVTALSNEGKVRITFDVLGADKVLEAVWPAGADGYLLAMSKKKHTHEIIAAE